MHWAIQLLIKCPENFPSAQCVELKIRWWFCVHTSTCTEIYFLLKFWIIFDISNTRSLLGLAQKHIWNVIEKVVFRNCTFLLFFKDNFFNFFSNMQIIVKIRCQKCQKLFKTLIRRVFQDLYCRAYKTATLNPIQHTVLRVKHRLNREKL